MRLIDSPPWSRAAAPIWAMLCHYPGERRRKRQLLMLKAYIDDSQNTPWFVLGGYIATAEAWARFSDDWQAALDMNPKVGPFKLSKARRWSDETWKERMPLLAAAIKNHMAAGISCAIPNQQYRAAAAGRKPHSDPYHITLLSLVTGLAKYQDKLNLTEPVDFVFDKGNSTIVFELWDKFRAGLPEEFRKLIGRKPLTGDDEEMPPLQAADFYAGYVRMKLTKQLDPKSPMIRPIRWPKDTKLFYLDLEMTEKNREGKVARKR